MKVNARPERQSLAISPSEAGTRPPRTVILLASPFRAPEPPARSTDYRAFVENVLEVERNAVALYHEMMGKYHDSDHLTFELAEDLLEAEVEEEERWERILEGL
jgi:ferritin-like protein